MVANLKYYEKKLKSLIRLKEKGKIDDKVELLCLYHDGDGIETITACMKRSSKKKAVGGQEYRTTHGRYRCSDQRCKKTGTVTSLIDSLGFFMKGIYQIPDDEIEKIRFLHRCNFERRYIKIRCLFHGELDHKWLSVSGIEYECPVCEEVGDTSNLVRLFDIFRGEKNDRTHV